MKIFISAAEASADAHGAELLKALNAEARLRGQTIEAYGLGGPKLQAAGLNIWQDGRELRAMGFTEILSKIPRGYQILNGLIKKLDSTPVVAAVFLDYPEFHFRLSKKIQEHFKETPLFYYIPPKLWVWRSGRARILRERFKKVFCIFPFELDRFLSLGVPVEYCGNPLLDELPLTLTQEVARHQLFVHFNRTESHESKNLPWVLLMPGSRVAEIKGHLILFLEALEKVEALKAGAEVLIPIQPQDRELVESLLASNWRGAGPVRDLLRIHILTEIAGVPASHLAMKACDFGLIKSGTSTLEAALMGLPHVLVYRPGAITSWLFRNLVRYKGFVGLTNLVLGRELVKEVLMEQATPSRLALELSQLDCAKAKVGFSEVREKLKNKSGESPSQLVAKNILDQVGHL